MNEENFQNQLKQAVEGYNSDRAKGIEINRIYEIKLKQLDSKKKELTQSWLNENDANQERLEEKRKQILNLQSEIRRIRSYELDETE